MLSITSQNVYNYNQGINIQNGTCNYISFTLQEYRDAICFIYDVLYFIIYFPSRHLYFPPKPSDRSWS